MLIKSFVIREEVEGKLEVPVARGWTFGGPDEIIFGGYAEELFASRKEAEAALIEYFKKLSKARKKSLGLKHVGIEPCFVIVEMLGWEE